MVVNIVSWLLFIAVFIATFLFAKIEVNEEEVNIIQRIAFCLFASSVVTLAIMLPLLGIAYIFGL